MGNCLNLIRSLKTLSYVFKKVIQCLKIGSADCKTNKLHQKQSIPMLKLMAYLTRKVQAIEKPKLRFENVFTAGIDNIACKYIQGTQTGLIGLDNVKIHDE